LSRIALPSNKFALLFSLWLSFSFCAFGGSATAQTAAPPAEMISNFRLQHGEGRVTLDSTLDRIAQEQATAMAAKDVLDHSVLGQFSARIAPSGSRRAAENIAYGYDSFPKTLNQWIESPEHRKNLLLPNASRVGVASAKSKTTGRVYWSMEIADYERPEVRGKNLPAGTKKPKADSKPSAKGSPPQDCRLKILSLCL
jgi:Cysteine-rich secretory protein family